MPEFDYFREQRGRGNQREQRRTTLWMPEVSAPVSRLDTQPSPNERNVSFTWYFPSRRREAAHGSLASDTIMPGTWSQSLNYHCISVAD